MKIFEKTETGPVLIAPLGDIQFTGKDKRIQGGCSVAGLRRHLSWLRKTADRFEARLSVLSTGDHVDLMSPSNRDAYKKSGLYSTPKRVISYFFSSIVDELAEILLEHLKPEEFEFIMYGHHWFGYDGEAFADTEQHLAALLGGIPTVPSAAYVRYKWPSATYNVLVEHGEGNGQSLAYGLNKLDKLAGGWQDVQCHAMGHTHKLGSVKKAKLSISDDLEVIDHGVTLLTTGAFLRGWKKDEVLYPEAGGMPPLPIGASAVLVEEDADEPAGYASTVFLR